MSFKNGIEAALEEARPSLMRHGGNIELVEADEETGIIKVRLKGACIGCPLSTFTMKLGIEKLLRERFPTIRDVIDLTEYEEGWEDDW